MERLNINNRSKSSCATKCNYNLGLIVILTNIQFRMKDLMGKAIWDFYHDNQPEDLQTETSISDLDQLPIQYLFRNYHEMNILEQQALQLSRGKVLDVGCGAGSHSLYLQEVKHLETTALDISPRSIQICQYRGIKNSWCGSILDFEGEKFDTILLLMNGTGIFQSLSLIDRYLQQLKKLLHDNGQILIDGTDILYMFDRDQDGAVIIPANGYYGEVDYLIHYKNETEIPFKWLYLDYETLKNAASNNGFISQKLIEHEDAYLAKLTLS